MSVVYVKEQGSIVRKRGGRMLVEKDGEQLLEIPLRLTSAVAVFGNVQVTTQALSELLDRGIPLALYTRHGRLKGHLAPELSKNLPLRLAQYKTALDEGAALNMARAVVRAKLVNTASFLDEHRANHPSETLAAAADAVRAGADSACSASTHAELLGCEGAAAAAYFEAFAEMNRSGLPFTGRERHPAPDPVNALLSFGYTLVLNEIRGLAEGAGLEPHLGFLHRVDYGRPSLALDLLEPFRAPLVDRLTLRLVNERILTCADFGTRVTGAGGVILLPDSLRRYLEQYEAAMTAARAAAPGGMRQALATQVESLARALRDGVPFAAYAEGV
jgi:CRISPR-associated protein Cas1